MKRFVVIVPQASPELQEKITRYFSEHFSWWHWSAECWLIVTPGDLYTTTEIRGLIAGLVGTYIQMLVLQVEVPDLDPWAGYGPPNWQEWLTRVWVEGQSGAAAPLFAPTLASGQ